MLTAFDTNTTNSSQDEFEQNARIWDPASSKWRTLDECVWKSQISLATKFVLTSEYEENVVSGLFYIHLKTGDITIDCLVDELQFLKDGASSEVGETLVDRASGIYALIKEMAHTDEDKKSLR